MKKRLWNEYGGTDLSMWQICFLLEMCHMSYRCAFCHEFAFDLNLNSKLNSEKER